MDNALRGWILRETRLNLHSIPAVNAANSNSQRPRLEAEMIPKSPVYPESGIKVFDFPCGCGGLSLGLEQAGMKPVFALDKDPEAMATFRHNLLRERHDVRVVAKAIEEFSPKKLRRQVERARRGNSAVLLAACAPCQPLYQTKHDPQRERRSPLFPVFARAGTGKRKDLTPFAGCVVLV